MRQGRVFYKNRLTKNKPKAEKLINQSFLFDAMKNAYLRLMDSRYAQLNLMK